MLRIMTATGKSVIVGLTHRATTKKASIRDPIPSMTTDADTNNKQTRRNNNIKKRIHQVRRKPEDWYIFGAFYVKTSVPHLRVSSRYRTRRIEQML